MLKRSWWLLAVVLVMFVGRGVAHAEDEAEEPVTIQDLLARMDVELPQQLSPEDFEILEERCKPDGDEDKLARCLVESDDVVSLYLAIAAEKKRVFGKELYVELAGMLAALPTEVITEARAACPQKDVAAAIECLMSHKVVGEVIRVYYDLAKQIVEEAANDIRAAGNDIDVAAYTDVVAQLFFQLPSGTILSLAGTCLKLHPELETSKSTDDIDKALECITEVGKTDPIANPAYISKDKLLAWLKVAREKVVDQIRGKETKKQDENFKRILIVILLLTTAGYLVVLLMPLVLRRRYPGMDRTLWKASAVAAGTFAITVALLGASLLITRNVQTAVATDSTSPKMRVADAAFAVLAKSEAAEALSALSKERLDFIKSPLRSIVEDQDGAGAERYAVFAAYLATHWADLLDEPELENIAKNVAMLKSHADSMKSVFGLYSHVDWLMGMVPILMSLLAVLLYLLPLKSMLADIVTAPARAAAGSARADDAAMRAMTAVKRELKSVLPFLAVILVLLPITGFFLALAMEPLVEMLIGYSLLTLFYILFADASAFVIYTSLGCAIVLLVVCIAAYIMAMGAVLGQTRKIFRAIFHLGYRFRDFKRFWLWSGAALIVLLALPFLYAYGAIWLATAAQSEDGTFGAKDLLLVPVPAVLLFPVMFWAARGWKSLTFIKKYPVPTTPAPAAYGDAT